MTLPVNSTLLSAPVFSLCNLVCYFSEHRLLPQSGPPCKRRCHKHRLSGHSCSRKSPNFDCLHRFSALGVRKLVNITKFAIIPFCALVTLANLYSQSPVNANRNDDVGTLDVAGVMRYSMTKGLCQKVIKNQASAEEIAQLVALFERLKQLDPPLGPRDRWQTLTSELLDSAKSVADGQPAHDRLKQAANCNACHRDHRPKR